ncbi:hypothetical protein [Pseudorhizobium flavum]|uniref:Uncharacterized protein n=1 Tax=Pseudorhizobium flavum TaxID=1335061 RepID=A0A7W9YYL4_9HYPH|nr:hypothetical protein [Pseudorhizobium flavum]MBB6180789.1 hypothetical protein [Pseudorhizobium flavum]
MLEFLRGVKTSDDLANQLANGVTFGWEGLRKFARCGSDAIHKNNPDLFAEIEAEKNRIESISLKDVASPPRQLGGDATLAELRAEVRRLNRAVKSKDQELNEAHLTNLTLLERVEQLERELAQERRSPRPI